MMNQDEGLVSELSRLTGIDFNKEDDVRIQLILFLNDLIIDDFNQLINIMYRIDVSEEKLKRKLSINSETDARGIIADLIIERLKIKIETRSKLKKSADDSQEERW